MAYNISEDKFICDICGFGNSWESNDEVHGELWGCEKCGKTFCTKCSKEKLGESNYYKIMQNWDFIMCPDCYGEDK